MTREQAEIEARGIFEFLAGADGEPDEVRAWLEVMERRFDELSDFINELGPEPATDWERPADITPAQKQVLREKQMRETEAIIRRG